MAEFVPATIVRVLKDVPLDSTYSDTIKFASVGAQTAFFAGKAKYSFTDFTYQRVNSSVASPRGPRSVRVPRVADDLYDCNYIMFQNSNYGSKWFYAFIKQVNYVNPNNTEIIYELDHYQTWAFDFTVLPSFVEREHTNDDKYYVNLEPEPVDISSYKFSETLITYFTSFPGIVVATSTNPAGQVVNGQVINNIYSGLQFNYFNSAPLANAFIQEYAESGHLDNVITVFMSPFKESESGATPWSFEVTPNIPGYTPRNKKLISSPFVSYLISDGSNNYQEFKYEFTSNDKESGSVTVSGNVLKIFSGSPIMVFVPNYITQLNYYYSIQTSFSAICPWSGNVYANWMAQNTTTLALRAIVNGTIGAATGNIGSAASSIANTAATMYSAQYINTPVHNPLDANVPIATGRMGFIYIIKSISAESAEYIDNFFDMYGYATNRVKVPNMEGRESWNYVKTNNVIIKGSVPVDSMDSIKAMFNNGIRFWHGDFVGDYSRSNRTLVEVQNNG